MTINLADLKQNERVTLTRGENYVTFFRTAFKFITMEYSLGVDKGLQEFYASQDQEAQNWLNQFLNDGYELSSRLIGYHESLPVKAGDTVTIRKGTIVKTVGRDPKPAGRTYKVKINHTLPGSNAHYWGRGRELVPSATPKVCWAGPGGYWSEADINDIPEAQPKKEYKVKVGETTYMVDVSVLGQVDVFHTMLDGLASSSFAGEATIKNGKLTDRDGLTEETWSAIQATVCV